jgi:hypothetical protein
MPYSYECETDIATGIAELSNVSRPISAKMAYMAFPVRTHRRRSPSTLMKKLAKIVCAPKARNNTDGITRRIA